MTTPPIVVVPERARRLEISLMFGNLDFEFIWDLGIGNRDFLRT
jgi:hypothetical protein